MKPFTEKRPWGDFRQFTKDELTTVKILTVQPGEAFSLQYHNGRAEFWRVLAGSPTLTIGDQEIKAQSGDEFMIEPRMRHRAAAAGEPAVILEISFGRFDEGDIVRIEDNYGRA